MLRENVSDSAIEKDIDRAWKDYPKGFVTFLQPGEVAASSKITTMTTTDSGYRGKLLIC